MRGKERGRKKIMDSVEEMDELLLKLIMIVVGGKYRLVEKSKLVEEDC